jgi:tRNA-modifying protein YgfZ
LCRRLAAQIYYFTMSPIDSAVSAAPPSSAALVAARDKSVACDLAPLSVLEISGPDAAAFLQGQLSNDVMALAESGAQFTSYNSPKGRMLANFVLWRTDAETFRALLPTDVAAGVQKRLAMFVLRSKVSLADVSQRIARFGLGGPTAADALRSAFGTVPAVFTIVGADGAMLLGLPGPRFVVTAPLEAEAAIGMRLARDAVRAPFAVWQWLTIRAGVPVVTAPMQDRLIAQVANWDVLGGVSFRKGCYTGQEIIARMQYLGRQKERLFAFHADTVAVAAGARVFVHGFGDQACGTVVNAAPAPEGGSDILAVMQVEAVDAGDLHLEAPHGPALVRWPLPYIVPPAEPPRGRAGAA